MTIFRRKQCISCGETKVVSKVNFYRHQKMADGFLNKCKVCVKRDVYENRELKAEYYRAYDRERNRRPERVAAIRAYLKSPAGKVSLARANRVYRRFKACEARA